MSTASMLRLHAQDIHWAASNNAIATHEFSSFTRYAFRDDSILVVGKDGSLTVYDEDHRQESRDE